MIDIYKDGIYFGTVKSFENLVIVNNNLKKFGEITFKLK